MIAIDAERMFLAERESSRTLSSPAVRVTIDWQSKPLHHGQNVKMLWQAIETNAHGNPTPTRAIWIIAERIRYLGNAFDLRQPNDIDQLVAAIEATDFHPDLIVFDTLARLIPGADENSSKDMGEVIRAMDDLRRRFDETVLPVHHTGKYKDYRVKGPTRMPARTAAAACSSSRPSNAARRLAIGRAAQWSPSASTPHENNHAVTRTARRASLLSISDRPRRRSSSCASSQEIEPAVAMPVEHCLYNRILVRAGSPVIGRVKAPHGYHRATSASAKSLNNVGERYPH